MFPAHVIGLGASQEDPLRTPTNEHSIADTQQQQQQQQQQGGPVTPSTGGLAFGEWSLVRLKKRMPWCVVGGVQ